MASPDTGGITLGQMLRHPMVLKVISRIKAPGNLFQEFYGLGIGSTATIRRPGRSVAWDIFDHTRTLAEVRAPASGPSNIQRKAIGVVTAQLVRLHEKLNIPHDEIHHMRPLGANIGTLDRTGQAYVARQVAYMTQRFRNAREFMVSRLFRGAFGIDMTGDAINLVESDGNEQITVDYQLPAENKGKIDDVGSHSFSGDWDDADTDVVGQLLYLNAYAEDVSGYPVRHIWINSTQLRWLLDNTDLQNIGGSAFRVFDSLTDREINTVDGTRASGYNYVFRAIPQFTFHVYDAVQKINTDDSGTSTLFIPNTDIIATPDPDPSWLGMAEGSEIVQENYNTAPREVFGFHSWSTPVLDPGGRELKMVDNSLPALFVPKAVWYLQVDGQ